MRRTLQIVLAILVIVLLTCLFYVVANRHERQNFSGGGPSASVGLTPSPPDGSAPAESPGESASPSPYTGPASPLSGLPILKDAVGKRPYAVVLDNLKSAQPQLGVSGADIIFEMPVEGGITRMLALFQDISRAGKIGSLRSARPYFVDVALGYDAILIHAGGSEGAYEEIKSTGLDHLDGVNGARQDVFFRDKQRRSQMGYEHSLVTTGSLVTKYVPEYGIRLDVRGGYDAGMSFLDDVELADGKSAVSVTAHFLASKTTAFTYSPEARAYEISQYGAKYVDGNSGRAVAAKNVLILKARISNIRGDDAGRLSIDLSGSGEGVFCCGGKYVPIRWEKSSEKSAFSFTVKGGGKLELARGLTYVCIVSTNDAVDIS